MVMLPPALLWGNVSLEHSFVFYHSLPKMPQIIKILSHDYTVSTSGHWLGNRRSKNSNSHGIDPVLLKYSDFSKKCFRSDEYPRPSNMWTWSACVELAPCLALLWCHNGCHGISNHQPHDCLHNRLFRCRSKKTSKFRVTGLCAGNSPVTRKMFPFDDVIMVLQCRIQYLLQCRRYTVIWSPLPFFMQTWYSEEAKGETVDRQCVSSTRPDIQIDMNKSSGASFTNRK